MRILLPTLHVRPSAQATPLAAACLKAALPAPFRDKAELLDLYTSQPVEHMLSSILHRHPDLVAFPLYLWNRSLVLELAEKLRRQRPEIFLLAGGPEASADCRTVLAEGRLDAVICGEGEEAFVALVRALAGRRPFRDIDGLCTADAAPLQTAFCENLQLLPSPYLEQVLIPEQGGGLLWEVARGCPFDCAFCYDAKGQQGVRPLPLERLAEELKLFAASGTEQIWVLDSTFNFPADRGHRLLELLLKTAPHIHYHLEAKAEFLDRETIRLLSRLNCSVQVGLQSADPRVLKPLHRSFDSARLFRRLNMLSEAGIVFGVDLIYGLPGDNHRGFRQSLNAALATEPNQVDLFPLAVLPGTRLHRDRQKLGVQALRTPPYEILSSPGYSPRELDQSRLLAAAADLFYNRGRAVGFMTSICHALDSDPAALLERFALWLQRDRGYALQQVLDVEEWQPSRIHPLQVAFLDTELRRHGKQRLLPLVHDLLSYHFNFAETLLGPELAPPPNTFPVHEAWLRPWRRSGQLRLIDFNYELDDLLNLGGMEPDELYRTLSPTGSTGLFLRRGHEVICESLQEDFARLLKESDGSKTPAEILPDCPPEEGMELLDFSLSQGLLHR